MKRDVGVVVLRALAVETIGFGGQKAVVVLAIKVASNAKKTERSAMDTIVLILGCDFVVCKLGCWVGLGWVGCGFRFLFGVVGTHWSR